MGKQLHKGKLLSKRLVLDPQGVMYSYFTWIQESVRGVEGEIRRPGSRADGGRPRNLRLLVWPGVGWRVCLWVVGLIVPPGSGLSSFTPSVVQVAHRGERWRLNTSRHQSSQLPRRGLRQRPLTWLYSGIQLQRNKETHNQSFHNIHYC